jgi:hypothetical protein
VGYGLLDVIKGRTYRFVIFGKEIDMQLKSRLCLLHRCLSLLATKMVWLVTWYVLQGLGEGRYFQVVSFPSMSLSLLPVHMILPKYIISLPK